MFTSSTIHFWGRLSLPLPCTSLGVPTSGVGTVRLLLQARTQTGPCVHLRCHTGRSVTVWGRPGSSDGLPGRRTSEPHTEQWWPRCWREDRPRSQQGRQHASQCASCVVLSGGGGQSSSHRHRAQAEDPTPSKTEDTPLPPLSGQKDKGQKFYIQERFSQRNFEF